MYNIRGLGQAEPASLDTTLQEGYNWIKSECHKRFDAISPDFCNSILPARAVYLPIPQERTGIKWYWWVAFGYLAAKIL